MKERSDADKKEPEPIGGIPFFASLLFLILLALINLTHLYNSLTEDTPIRWIFFGAGIGIGAAIGTWVIGGHVAVFLHEMKHVIVSNLAGNRAKGMLVKNDHGHFEYMYSARTAHLNPIIALAPYFFPAVTIPLVLISVLAFSSIPALPLLFAGIGYAIDMTLSYRDIGPWQTDLTTIRGGYPVGVLYVIAMNVVLFTILAAWINGGVDGLSELFIGLFSTVEGFFGVSPPQR